MRFIHIPKNAGTSIQNTLGPTSLGHRRVYEVEECGPLFTCIRNPYDRAASIYWFMRQQQGNAFFNMVKTWKDVNEFWLTIDESGLPYHRRIVTSQISFLRDKKGVGEISSRIETVLRYETLTEDWPAFALLHDLPPLPHKNKSEGRTSPNWQEELSAESIAKIGELYADDFEHLNYERIS